MTVRLEIGWRPVTSKLVRNELNSGKTSPEELVLKMVRQPRIKPVLASLTGVQAEAPMYKRLLLAMVILVCSPLVMLICAEAVEFPVLMVCKLPPAAQTGVAVATGAVATNKLEPLRRPTVAPQTGMGVPKTGVAPLKSSETTLAADPPHSAPQFRIDRKSTR